MKVTRVYADTEGHSHFGEVEIQLRDGGTIGRLSHEIPAHCVVLRENDPDYNFDWHPAPRRQFVVLLDGQIEIEVSDGEKRTFDGGDILLVEDTTGKGHRTCHTRPHRRRSIFIVLDDTPLEMRSNP